MSEYCAYCGHARGDKIGCCGENHFMTGKEFFEYHGELAEDDDNEPEDYAE
jgi:hypothetical protein